MIDYDPGSPDVLADPASAYASLRSECPVHRFDGLENPMYTLAMRQDVQDVLTDQDVWSNRHGPGISYGDHNVGDLQRYDPPVHETRRRFLRDPFLPRAVQASAPRIEALANELVDDLLPRGQAELHDDYALPLPITGFTDMMGIADVDAGDFKTWADELTLGMTYPDRSRDARRAMTDYTRAEVRKRRAAKDAGEPIADGLLSHLACDPIEDGSFMPDQEVAGMVSQLLVAGHETTTSLITNAVWRLLEDRARWERLVSDPTLVPNVIEESLRFDPPVLGICKTNNVAVQRQEVAIPEESKVMVLYASANRDPEVFDEPDVFKVDRPLLEAKRHLAFGWGAHFCLGSHLARLTARTALDVLIRRLPQMEPAGDTTRVGAPFLWGRATLPVSW